MKILYHSLHAAILVFKSKGTLEMPRTIPVTFTLPPDSIDYIAEYAKKQGDSKSRVYRECVEIPRIFIAAREHARKTKQKFGYYPNDTKNASELVLLTFGKA